MSLAAALRGARRAVLDTMILIYYLEDSVAYGELAETVIQAAAEQAFEGIITPVTAAELLVKPLAANRPDLADRYRLAMATLGNTKRCPLSWEAGCMAGALRAAYGLPLPDMCQVAIAMEHAPCALITNDRALRQVREVPVVLLDDLAPNC